jgi:hypothetical protein
VEIRKYQELCKIFDQVLAHKDVTPQVTANKYLHVLSSHPESIAKYRFSKITKILLLVRFKLIAIVKVGQSIFDKKHYYTNSRLEQVQSDVLFISHLVSKRQLSNDNDSYFGNLPSELLDYGVSSSIALIKYVKVDNEKALRIWNKGNIVRFILSPSLDFLSETKLYLAQRKSKKQLKSILKDLKVDRGLVKNILCHHLSSGAFSSLRIAKQVAEIARKTGAKFIVTTYEGHAWERLVYYYVRKINPDVKCFGYQHAAVFENQHAIKRPLGAMYNPDVILTSGLIAKDILEKNKLKGSKVVCVGSPKYSKSSTIKNKSQSCLVLPEGFVSECLILFKLSLEYAKQHSEQIFIWRLHPIISFKELKKHSSIFKDLPNNIILSKDSLDDDIQKCNSVIYRGSTAVVNAINAGLKPIYYQQFADELSIDPIYTCHVGKFFAHNQETLTLALETDICIDAKQSLQDYAQNFYTPLNLRVFLEEIKDC